jgi:hypothetical protein
MLTLEMATDEPFLDGSLQETLKAAILAQPCLDSDPQEQLYVLFQAAHYSVMNEKYVIH